ncbi:MAG: M24 family metallopeptidase [Myxococcota bacterium]
MSQELPEPIRAFDDAQRRAIGMLRDVTQRLEAGMSERDVFELAETRLGEHGFDGWFHAPHVFVDDRIAGTLLPRPSASVKLEPGKLVSIDLGPASGDAYGDVGTTIHFGGGEEPAVLQVARECVRACCGYASRWKTVGEVFIFAQAWAVNHRMDLASKKAVGHRVLPKEGWLATGFPRSAHAATLLGRNRIHRLNPVRMSGMFAIRPVIEHDGLAAGFEEMIYIKDDVRKVLGRESLAEIGAL